MIKAPCLNCDKRKLHCHENCTKYKDYKTAMAQLRVNMKLSSLDGRKNKPHMMYGYRY